ncbi:MAG: Uma2 family endonuclease [Synechococcales cyanobacterium]
MPPCPKPSTPSRPKTIGYDDSYLINARYQPLTLRPMAILTQRLTFEAYLAYNDGIDIRHELIDGELSPMSLGTGKHTAIIRFLSKTLEQQPEALQQNWVAIPVMIGIRSPRGTRWDTVRIPDITVIPNAQLKSLEARQCVIDLHEPHPLLLIEVVSESTKSADYRAKWVEYSALNISEYWIIDCLDQLATVCILEEGRYQDTIFRGSELMVSPTFPSLNLTPTEIWEA